MFYFFKYLLFIEVIKQNDNTIGTKHSMGSYPFWVNSLINLNT